MQIQHFEYTSSDGVTQIEAIIKSPSAEIKGIVQISHGLKEHFGRYEKFMDFLVDEGFVVVANNHLGHGRSVKEELPGYFGAKNSYQFLVEDLYKLSEIAREQFGEKPLFLLGHSMGSFIARLYMTRYKEELSGAIISGTSGPNFKAEFPAYYYAKTIAKIKGERNYDKRLTSLTSNGTKGKFAKDGANAWLTSDSKEQDKYSKDGFCNFSFTIGGYREMFKMMRLVGSKSWAESVSKSLPILFVSGEKDPVGNYGKGVEKVARRLGAAGVSDITLMLYEDGRHEMLNEVNHLEVYQDILAWIEEKLSI